MRGEEHVTYLQKVDPDENGEDDLVGLAADALVLFVALVS
jgi:hypothetical protein